MTLVNLEQPSWSDIEHVFDFILYLYSKVFANRYTSEIAKRAQDAVKDIWDDYFDWIHLSTIERRELVKDFLTRVSAAVTGHTQGPDDMTLSEALYDQTYIDAVSETMRRGVRTFDEAHAYVVEDDFDFTRFRHAYLEAMPRTLLDRFREMAWRAFYDRWNDTHKAQMAMLEEYRRRVGSNMDKVFLFPNQIDQLIATYVQSTEDAVRSNGGNVGKLFPWPV